MMMVQVQVEGNRITGDKEILRIRIEGISNNSSSSQGMQISFQRITIWCSGNRRQMILSIPRPEKQIKVKLVLVEINMNKTKTIIDPKVVPNINMLSKIPNLRFNLVDQLESSNSKTIPTIMPQAWEINTSKTKDNNKKRSHQLLPGQAKVEEDKFKAEKTDGQIKIIRLILINNTKENLNIKTSGKALVKTKIQDIQGNNNKHLLRINTKGNLNMKIKVPNIQENNRPKRNKAISIRGIHKTKNKKTSIKENLNSNSRTTKTKEILSNSIKIITTRNHRQDHKLVQAPSLLSNTLVTHQVENHKLHSDISSMNF
jgi:hypothetical protein